METIYLIVAFQLVKSKQPDRLSLMYVFVSFSTADKTSINLFTSCLPFSASPAINISRDWRSRSSVKFIEIRSGGECGNKSEFTQTVENQLNSYTARLERNKHLK